MKNIFSSWLRNTMLVAVLFFAAAPLSHAQEEEIDDVMSLMFRTNTYAHLSPAERVALLLDDESRDILVPDNVIFLKDLKAMFSVGMDSSRYKIDTPNPFSSVENAQSYYNTLMAIVQSGTNYSVVYDTVSLPEEVVADVLFNIHDSSSCSYGQDGVYSCPLTLPMLLNVLNAYYSCTPAERAIFYDTFCNPNSTSAVAQLFNNRMQLPLTPELTMQFYELIATTDMEAIDDTSGNLDAFRYNALPGVFTIDANGGKVHFSQGNIQYQPSTHTWRFAENQYDCIGNANNQISQTSTGWIDLFGWGTGSDTSQFPPYLSDATAQYGPTDNRNITNTVYDWGYNAISNGGNQYAAWRTLTSDEWNYLLFGRHSQDSCHYAYAKVNSINGLVIFPDGFNRTTSPFSFSNVDAAGTYQNNTIPLDIWTQLDSLGCVFLPSGGMRSGTNINLIGNADDTYNCGLYWSSSADSEDITKGKYVWIKCGYALSIGVYYKRYGLSVRPVRDVSVSQSEVGQFQSIDGTGTTNNGQNTNTNTTTGREGDGTVTDPVTDDDNPPANTGVVTGGPQ